jgi:hypothetical protein
MVEAGGVETNSGTENAQLIDFRDAQNAKNSANWNVSGTQPQAARTSGWSTCPISAASYRTGVLLPDSADQALAESGS